jgi:hypothetical protein
MKEGIEKNITKKENKKTTLERLKEIKEKEEEAIEEDKLLHARSWEHINPKLLIDQCRELFDLFSRGDYESLSTAKDKLPLIQKEINKIKDKDQKNSNQEFLYWIDDKIARALQIEIDKREISKT